MWITRRTLNCWDCQLSILSVVGAAPTYLLLREVCPIGQNGNGQITDQDKLSDADEGGVRLALACP